MKKKTIYGVVIKTKILINNIDMISWDQPLCHVNCRQVNCPDDFAGFHLIDQHSV